MNEDDIYRTSTQYRHWSYTEESLASLRVTTNLLATTRVKDAIKRKQLESNGAIKAGDGGTKDIKLNDIDCLTVEEEQRLVDYYCTKAMELADFCEFPTNVKATAVQYLRRFYLSNSPMTYHPKQIMPSALFLATKTDNNYISLKNFVSKLGKATPEDVVAPEFLLTQGLRFMFDVRHPQRGLEGGFMELQALASGRYVSVAAIKASPKELQSAMMKLTPALADNPKPKTAEEVKVRIQIAHGKAKEILKTSALLTDAYFLYTPSQIWLSALLLADKPLATFYVELKLRNSDEMTSRVMLVLESCAELMRLAPSVNPGEAEMKELKRIDKKLYQCRNPEKIDLVGMNKSQKRDGEAKGSGRLDEKIVKKRKMERENHMKEGEELFGSALVK